MFIPTGFKPKYLKNIKDKFPIHFLLLGLTLIAELGGYLGLFLGYSLMSISGPISYVWIKFRYCPSKNYLISLVSFLVITNMLW